jgi:hypothetical protein
MPTAVTFYTYAFEGAPLHGTYRGWVAAPGIDHLVATRARTALGRAAGPRVAIYRCNGVLDGEELTCEDVDPLLYRDATDDLRWFALFCARSVAARWEPPKLVREFLWFGDRELRSAAHQEAWLASATHTGVARIAARVAMYAAHEDRCVFAAREAARLAAQLADDGRAAAAGQERALASTLLAVVERTLEKTAA